MSLVNDMLRDLEERKSEGVSQTYVSADRRDYKRGRRQKKVLLVIGLACFLVVLAVSYKRLFLPHSEVPVASAVVHLANAESKSVTASADVSNTVAAELLSATSTALQPAAKSQSLTDTQGAKTSLSTIETQHNHEIDILLVKAELALVKDRLTKPKRDNAYDYFQHILSLVPGHPGALEGLQKIKRRYSELAKIYQRKKKAQQRVADSAAERPAASTDTVSTDTTPTDTTRDQHLTKVAGNIEVRPSFSEQDRKHKAQALALIEGGEQAQAKKLLQGFVNTHAKSVYALNTLLQLHLQLKEWPQAETLLSKADHLSAHQHLYWSAQILLQKNDIDGAIAALEKQRPPLNIAADYYSLLAGLYHQTNRYQQAADLYRQLLQLDKTRGPYWLGLAVCLDALNDQQGALQAFRFAYRYSPTQADTRSYIQQRIQALST